MNLTVNRTAEGNIAFSINVRRLATIKVMTEKTEGVSEPSPWARLYMSAPKKSTVYFVTIWRNFEAIAGVTLAIGPDPLYGTVAVVSSANHINVVSDGGIVVMQ